MSKFTNSQLVTYTKISPNKTSPRNKPIDTITIHCVAGNCTIETIGAIFAPTSRQASSNYGIGSDGRIGMYVEEKDRSWCSSSAANDNRAITIEVANTQTVYPWAVTDEAYKSLIDLVTDICMRNEIKQLTWRDDKNNPGNITVHNWFANKACPGQYLQSRHDILVKEVNKRLSVQDLGKVLYRVQTGAFSKIENAEAMLAKIKASGFKDAFISVTKTS